MKGSSKHSKLPIAELNDKKQAKIDKLNNADVVVISNADGVMIVNGDKWIGISPAIARKISTDLIAAAKDSEKKKKGKA